MNSKYPKTYSEAFIPYTIYGTASDTVWLDTIIELDPRYVRFELSGEFLERIREIKYERK